MGEWWRGCVIYQIYPRSFQDSNGDGIGDLPGILTRLEHVANLGVDAVWLSPFFTSPMADMGYDVSNYKDVDPLFGTLDDFDKIITYAHKLGLKVIIDQVLSHTSDQHPWFSQSKNSTANDKADWYVWADPNPDGTPPNNWLSIFGGPAWEWNTSRRQYYLHNFLGTQPDLNFHNRDVQDAILDVLKFWLDRGVDGFRFDTVNFYFHDQQLRSNQSLSRKSNRPEINPYEMQVQVFSKNQPENLAFLKRVRALLNKYDAITSVGEVGDSLRAIEIMADYTKDNDKLHMAYSFDLLGPDFSAKHFRSKVEEFEQGAPDGWPCWSFSNHDVTRHITRWAKHATSEQALARQTFALLSTLKGTICIYQGEELGLPEAEIEFEELTDPPGIRFWPEYKGRDGCRTPMPWTAGVSPNGFTDGTPWLPLKGPHSALNVQTQSRDAASTLNFYQKMLSYRKSRTALITGDIQFIDTPEPILAFTRTSNDTAQLCIFNLSPHKVKVMVDHIKALQLSPLSQAASSTCAHSGCEKLHLEGNGFALFDIPNHIKKLPNVEFKPKTQLQPA